MAYDMFQSGLKDQPFWMLVACCLVNKTSWRQAGPVLTAIRSRWKSADDLQNADPDDLRPVVRTLGFGNQRADRLVKMAAAYVASPPTVARDVLALPGCGQYAADSWAIFIDGRTDVSPTDKELSAYLNDLVGFDRAKTDEGMQR